MKTAVAAVGRSGGIGGCRAADGRNRLSMPVWAAPVWAAPVWVALVWAAVMALAAAGDLRAQTQAGQASGLQLNFFGARGPDGQAQSGRGLILSVGGAGRGLIQARQQRYSIFFDGYSNAVGREGRNLVHQAAQRALAVQPQKIEVLADPDGTATNRSNDAFIRATAVRQALLGHRDLSRIPIEIVTTPGISPEATRGGGALLRDQQRVEIRFLTR